MEYKEYLKEVFDNLDKNDPHFEYNFCGQWVKEQTEMSNTCWIKPDGKVIPVDFTRHQQVLCCLIFTGRLRDVKDERDAELRGWVKRTFSGWEIGKFPVINKIRDFIWDEFMEDMYVNINAKVFADEAEGYPSVYSAEDLDKFLDTGYV